MVIFLKELKNLEKYFFKPKELGKLPLAIGLALSNQ
jgi:hypothetical protein